MNEWGSAAARSGSTAIGRRPPAALTRAGGRAHAPPAPRPRSGAAPLVHTCTRGGVAAVSSGERRQRAAGIAGRRALQGGAVAAAPCPIHCAGFPDRHPGLPRPHSLLFQPLHPRRNIRVLFELRRLAAEGEVADRKHIQLRRGRHRRQRRRAWGGRRVWRSAVSTLALNGSAALAMPIEQHDGGFCACPAGGPMHRCRLFCRPNLDSSHVNCAYHLQTPPTRAGR